MALIFKSGYSKVFSNTLYITGPAPIDLRTVVETYSDLTTEYNNMSVYKGMLVSVQNGDKQGVYMLINPALKGDESGWKKVGGSDIAIDSSFIHFNNPSLGLDVSKSSSDSSWPNRGLATDGYVDEQLSWVIITES